MYSPSYGHTLAKQGGDPNHIPALNSNQEYKEPPQRAEKVYDTMAQLPALVSDGQPKKDPQRATEALNTRVKPFEPVPLPVKEHTMLLQASNDDQLGFQENLSRNQSKGNRPIAGTRGLKLCVLQAVVRKAAIPKVAYDETPKLLVTLLWEA